ncbi:hypothetical protein C8Q80DRAFT_1271586 [Daedaleopsis nitida]|nr:hypothetical protein C8Q80DRAFT_1271586 [Daedaleopsis nitida]
MSQELPKVIQLAYEHLVSSGTRRYMRTEHFPSHSLLDYAPALEKATTSKKDTLIQNGDGCIANFVDLLRDSGAFASDEADKSTKIAVTSQVPVPASSHEGAEQSQTVNPEDLVPC